ncbi:MAG: pimeloyl-ACP methyl ester carboxylesterase [Myxococcota bacterium]|jgi:pimeloyl-ACP methyl ester carboxylesterase
MEQVQVSWLRSRMSLGRWLGPWTPALRVPGGVTRRRLRHTHGGHTTAMSLYTPDHRPPIGSLLVAHGVHFLGPIDPRFDRFCRVLARAGWAVMAPSMIAYRALVPDETVPRDFRVAFEALRAQPGVPKSRPGIFSISFGAMPALHLASDPDYVDKIGGLVVFGGYADWTDTLRYMIDGHVPGASHDDQSNPLNRPVVFMNVLPFLDEPLDGTEELIGAWRRYVECVWPDPEMKHPDRHRPIAAAIEQTLPTHLRRLFRLGCGVEPGGDPLVIKALQRGDPDREALLDLKPRLAAVRCPVTLVHGVSDDVIHHSQIDVLAAGLTRAAAVRRLRTGLYGHSSSDRPGMSAIIGELHSLFQTLDGIACAATDARR